MSTPVNWEAYAKALKDQKGKQYESALAMFTDMYSRYSLHDLALRFGTSTGTIRKALSDLKIPIRGRGGPQGVKVKYSADLEAEVAKDGLKTVAARLGVTYSTLYKVIFRSRGLRRNGQPIVASPASEQKPEDPPSPGGPDHGGNQ